MTKLLIAIVFGGSSSEHGQSIVATKCLYENAIKGELDTKYDFEYFYIGRDNKWAGPKQSFRVLLSGQSEDCHGFDRMTDLSRVSVVYNTMMGSAGETGDIMGVCNLLNVPIIGCGILASALSLDKRLSKLLAERIDVPTVPCLYVKYDDDVNSLVKDIEKKIKFPCFTKPTNLGTCAFIFRANNANEFIKKWNNVVKKNYRSSTYIIEKFIPNLETRVFVHQDINGKLCFNDEYVTELKEKALEIGGGLFDHRDNKFPEEIREQIKKYAGRIFKVFGMKDYCRIDFFVDINTHEIYFNECNTQPFQSTFNIKLMKRDGYTYAYFIDTMIRRNIKY
jgi:D-alanine-D-alanine ligase